MRGAWLSSFEFKEFEEFEIHPDTLRPFGWRRIEYAQRATTAATLRVPTVVKVLSVFGRDRCERPPWMTVVDFFSFDSFSTSSNFSKKCLGPGASEKPLGIWGGKTEQKSIQQRGRNLRAKKLRLGNDLCRFWIDLGRVLGGVFVDFLLVFVIFRRN